MIPAVVAIQETKRRLARAVRSLDRINAAREAMAIQADALAAQIEADRIHLAALTDALAAQIEADRIHLAALTGERRVDGIRPLTIEIVD